MKLLIKFPTRSRKTKFFEVLDLYYNLLADKDNTEFCVSMDTDDISMNNNEVFYMLESYDNLSYFVSNNKSKIQAINADMEEFDDFDIVLLASDDMIPQIKGYDQIIRDNMEKYYPDTDGILWFYDGNRRDINTLCCLGKKYYDRFKYIYFPNYKSVYVDNEFTLVGNKLKRQTFIDQVIIKHEHPDIPEFRDRMDNLYIENSKYYPIDYKLFMLRQKNNFGIRNK